MPPRDHAPQFSEDKPLVASPRNIAVPLWCVASIVLSTVTFTFYAVMLLNSINGKLDNLGRDRWKLSHQRQWSFEFERLNPTLKFPDPDSIPRRIDQQ